MLSFKNFLTERLTSDIHPNITAKSLMSMSKEESTRFSIFEDGKMAAGRAKDYVHQHLNRYGKDFIRGNISFDPVENKHYYSAHQKNDKGKWVKADHPILARLEKYGAERGTLEGDFDYQHTRKSTPEDVMEDVKLIDYGNRARIRTDNKNDNQYKVFVNPTRAQMRTLAQTPDIFGEPSAYRSLRHGVDHYVWNALDGVHYDIKKHFGLKATDKTPISRGYFTTNDITRHGNNIDAIHNNARDKVDPDILGVEREW